MKSPNDQKKKEKGKAVRVASSVEGHFQGKVLAGFLGLVPLIVTAIVLLFFINTADGYVRQLPFVAGEPWDVTGIGIVVVVVGFYLIGLLIAFRFGRWIITIIEEVFLRVPVVKVIYKLMRQVTKVVASDYGFSRVVFVEWPREGMVALGFVTGRIIAKNGDHSLVSVYIPTVPNPTSGNMAFIHEDDVMETDLSVDAAMKLVFSGGFVIPENLSMARMPRGEANVHTEFTGAFESESSFRGKESRRKTPTPESETGIPAVGGPMPKNVREGTSS